MNTDEGRSAAGSVSSRVGFRQLLGKPDRTSLEYLAVVLLGFPLIEWISGLFLSAEELDEDTAFPLAEGFAAVCVGFAVYLLSRRLKLAQIARDELDRRLQKVTDRYRRMAENASDIVYSAGTDRNVTWISPSVTRVLGWEPLDIVGRSMASFIHPDDRASSEEVRDRIYSGQEYVTPVGGFVMRFAVKTGGYRWLAIHTKQLADEQGKHVAVVGGLTLVDDLVEARHRAEADEQLLRITADAMLDPQVVLEAVRDGAGKVIDFTYVEVNRATCEYLSMPRETLIGKGFLEITPRAEAEGFLDLYRQALESDEPVTVDGFVHENTSRSRTSYYDIHARRVSENQLALTWRDVTDMHLAAERIAQSEQHFRLLAENSSDVILLSDDATRMHWVSPASALTLGWKPEELQGRLAVEFVHPDDRPELLAAVAHSAATGEAIRPRYRWRHPDGSYRWVESAGRPVSGDDSGYVGRVVAIRGIDAEVAAQAQLKRRATFDDLTGALQREAAFDRLADIERRPRAPGSETGVLFIDIDDFKRVNDRWGHATGDAVLRTIAKRTRTVVRGSDAVARMGGDEFLVILEGVDSLDRALQVAQKIHEHCANPISTPTGELLITISIGVTLIGHSEGADATIARADQAMYAAKDLGRNQVLAIPLV